MTEIDFRNFDFNDYFKLRYSLYLKHLLNPTLYICLTFRIHQLRS